MIDTQRAVQGMPPVDDASFNSMGFKGARDAALGAIEFLKPTPTFSLDKNSPNYLPIVLAQKQQQLQQYQDHKDGNGKPDADPSVVTQLKNGIDYLQKSWDSSNKQEAQQAADVTTATENAKKPFVEEEHTFQTNLQTQAKALDRQNADTVQRNLEADKMTTKESDTLQDALKSIKNVRDQLDLSKAGNQQASQDVWTAFAANELRAHGVNRITTGELKNLVPPLARLCGRFRIPVIRPCKARFRTSRPPTSIRF